MEGISEDDFSLFKNVIDSFYYPENPLLGDVIWEGKEGAVYTRSKNDYSPALPCCYNFGRKGAVFCSYQLLGSNPFNIVVYLHNYTKDDRERNTLYDFEVVEIFSLIACYIDPHGAMEMLEKMRRYWNSVPKKRIDISSWSRVICMLVRKTSESPTVTSAFRKRYPNLLALRPITTIKERNRRGQARAWLNSYNRDYLLVQGEFVRFGYMSLEEFCEQNGGFVIDDSPGMFEDKGFEVIEILIRELYEGFFDFTYGMPTRKIISNERASYHGMATLFRRSPVLVNNWGVTVRYEVRELYLKRSAFHTNGFYNSLSTYVHEMCHQFGGDSSNAFSTGLTYAMEILLQGTKLIEEYKKKWETIFSAENDISKKD